MIAVATVSGSPGASVIATLNGPSIRSDVRPSRVSASSKFDLPRASHHR
jgi:hypothetical protein